MPNTSGFRLICLKLSSYVIRAFTILKDLFKRVLKLEYGSLELLS